MEVPLEVLMVLVVMNSFAKWKLNALMSDTDLPFAPLSATKVTNLSVFCWMAKSCLPEKTFSRSDVGESGYMSITKAAYSQSCEVLT